MSEQRVVPLVLAAVMAGHFVAAFAALGMPPFFGLILEQSLHNEARFLAGWLYVVPTALAALSSPWWGRIADRYGKKRLLVRAQLGLAASFLLAGYATNTWMFLGALALQGVLGGTFAASNAYLATVESGQALARSLTAMQWSARAALVAAPLALGVLLDVHVGSPITVYRWFALLPVAAALLVLFLPSGAAGAPERRQNEVASAPAEFPAQQVYALQAAFVFATVVTFPYFTSHVQQHFDSIGTGAAGALFGLPHAVYLLVAWPLTRWSARGRRITWLTASFLLLLASLLAQASSNTVAALVGWRLVMGVAMTLGFIALHGLIASCVQAEHAGRSFGWFESSSKWGAVAAGLGAGISAQHIGLAAPFLLGAIVLGAATVGLLVHSLSARASRTDLRVLREGNTCTSPTPKTSR